MLPLVALGGVFLNTFEIFYFVCTTMCSHNTQLIHELCVAYEVWRQRNGTQVFTHKAILLALTY